MKVFSRYILVVLFSGLIFSCRPSKICPAYHSYFILDPAVTKTTFSLFGPDSLPKDPTDELWQIDKKKVGIADEIAYKKKLHKQAIISMESIYLKKEDPFESQMAMAETDSSMVDSLRIAKGQRREDFYNYDQMIYLHYFGKYLPKPKPQEDIRDDLNPDEEPVIVDEPTEANEPDSVEKKGFFNKLFNKKKNKKQKENIDDPAEQEIQDDDSNN